MAFIINTHVYIYYRGCAPGTLIYNKKPSLYGYVRLGYTGTFAGPRANSTPYSERSAAGGR